MCSSSLSSPSYDASGIDANEILQCRTAIPVFGDVKLAGRLAQPRGHQNHRHVGPLDPFTSASKRLLAELVQLQGAPQEPREPDISERPTSLEPDLFGANSRDLQPRSIVKELELVDSITKEVFRESRGLSALLGIECSEIGDRFLANLAALSNRPDEGPVGVCLAVLLHRRVP